MGMSGGVATLLLLAVLVIGREAASSQGIGLSGRVTWQGTPVREARVRIPELGIETLTDSAGRYAFGAGPSSLDRDPAGPPGTGKAGLPGGGAGSVALINLLGRAIGRSVPATFHPAFRVVQPGHPAKPQAAPAVPGLPGVKRSGSRSPGEITAAAPAPATLALEVSARGYRTRRLQAAMEAATVDVPLERDARRHLWIWGSATVTSPSARDGLFAFAASKGVGTLYQDAEGPLDGDRAALRAYLDSTWARGFAVELLLGAADWALAENHTRPVSLARQAAALAREVRSSPGSGPAALPTAVQLDVEPYSLPQWAADRDAVAGRLVDMYTKVAAELRGSGIGLAACIPRWFDGIPLARAGRTRPLSEWLADETDRLTLMDYVDHAAGIIDGAEDEIAYAEAAGKEVVIGVETMFLDGTDPETVTFAEEGEAAMDAALAETYGRFGAKPPFFGFAVHHYGSWPTLKP